MTDHLDADVLIVGAGPVGLVAAMDLDSRGVSCIVVEQREAHDLPSVRSNHVSARTMEQFRRLGIADSVRAAGLPADHPHDAAFRTTVVGTELARVVLPSPRARSEGAPGADTDWPTPEPAHRINQTFLEPILLRHASGLPNVALRAGTRFLRYAQSEDGVEAVVSRAGEESTLRARYLIGADGGRSGVRKQMGAVLAGEPVLQRVQSTYIRAPRLMETMEAPPAWVYYTYNSRRNGGVFAIDGRERFLVHNHLTPLEAETSSVDRLDSIRAILGVDPSFEIEVISEEDWVARRLVVDRMRDRRVFLAGDAAHVWVPFAGYGMNAGIADALSLSWLIGARVAGWAHERILDAYEAERLPVTDQVSRFAMAHQQTISAEQIPDDIEEDTPEGAASRAAIGAYAYELNVGQFAAAGLNFGYSYDESPIIEYDGESPPPFSMGGFTPSTVPGCRTPHVWLPDGTSLYDHLGEAYTLICTADPAPLEPLIREAVVAGIPLAVVDLRGSADAATAYDKPFVLVRQDQHVAWRGDRPPRDARKLLGLLAGV